ncbi:hypothetical protein HYC85_021095 [Camellia sinensis]|uniref:Oxidoreductase molybdopterin-binding domain-containing protein n=1 Tax=Camellia sinensis TaxID=4442 RepID=A0A7J7GKL6_CAMSI|nr:hypothetical protein HYC85_021095 [Camellia sinensis]
MLQEATKYNLTATLQCAGNRRTAMSKVRAVKGVGWDISAIGNAIWGGAKLADVLELVGIPKLTKTTPLGGKHVEFVSVDMCKPLNRDHGYPLRVVVPGVIGARSVKWLDSINIIGEECQSPRSSVETPARAPLTDSRSSGQTPARAANALSQKFLQTGPRSSAQLPARASLTTSRSSIQSPARAANTTQDILDGCIPRSSVQFPARADKPKSRQLDLRAICSLEDDNTVQHGKFHNIIYFVDNMILILVFIIVMMQVEVHGYAVSGGGRGIERLNVSFDGDKARVEASRHQKSGIPYNAIADDDKYCDKWAWVLLKLKVMSSTIQRFLSKL